MDSNRYIFQISININKYLLIVIVGFSIIENYILLSLVNGKKFFIQIKKNAYSLIVIIKNLLFGKNIKIDKKTELLLVIT